MHSILLCLGIIIHHCMQGELRICCLPSHMTYDSPWPVCKVPTNSTVHYTSYHMESKTHVVVTSNQKPVTELPVNDNPDQTERVERGVSSCDIVMHRICMCMCMCMWLLHNLHLRWALCSVCSIIRERSNNKTIRFWKCMYKVVQIATSLEILN